MKILVKNNKERVKNQEAEMKKVQKLLKRSLATGLALVMIVSSMTIVPGSWQVHAAEASGQIGISNADELKKIGKDKDYPMDGDYVLTDDINLSGSDWTRSEEAAAVSMPSFPVNVFLTVRLTEPVM